MAARWALFCVAVAGCQVPVPVAPVSVGLRVPDLASGVERRAREQARHVLALGDGRTVVVGRRMAEAEWESPIRAWVAMFDGPEQRRWSVEDLSSDASGAERAAWSDEHGLFVAGRSASSLWVRGYGPRGGVRWEQRVASPQDRIIGLSASVDEGAWVLVQNPTDLRVDGIHVSALGQGEPAEVRDRVDDGVQAVALPGGSFYLADYELVLHPPSEGSPEWDVSEAEALPEGVGAAALDAQALFRGPVGAAPLPASALLAVQDGERFALKPRHADEPPLEPAWGLPWETAEDARRALSWFRGTEAGELYEALSGTSQTHALHALLEPAFEPLDPPELPIGCHEYETVEVDASTWPGHEHDALTAVLVETAPTETARALQPLLLDAIDNLTMTHPLTDAFLGSLESHGQVGVAVALAKADVGTSRSEALRWLEAGGHQAQVAELQQVLYEGGDDCEFVAETRAALRRMGASVPAARTSSFASACDQIYELCVNEASDEVMVPESGFLYATTCSDSYTDPEPGSYAEADPCEAATETGSSDYPELANAEMESACVGNTISYGEYDPTGNCGAPDSNDTHTIEFVESGDGRWVISAHRVHWTIE